MFLIVEFKYTELQTENKISKFNSPNQIIDFVAEKSTESEGFEIVCINDYKEGKLIPYELTFNKGRIELLPVPIEQKSPSHLEATLRKALWVIQKMSDSLGIDYTDVDENYQNVMSEITEQIQWLEGEQ